MAADFRETISEALDELAANDLKEVLKSVFSLETLQYGHCPECDSRVRVTTPDYKGMAAALAAFDGIGKGKQKDASEVVVDDEKVRQALLRVMSDWDVETLERIAGS